MKKEQDFFPFGPDPSWYEKYWYGEEPAQSFGWAKRLFLAIGKFCRVLKQKPLRAALRARQHGTVANKI